MVEKLAWGILGTGTIAGIFAEGLASSRTGRLVAVGSRTQAGADAFGERWHIPHRHGSYEELLADEEVQILYIAMPHPLHAEWAIKAAEAGKHILCEKPLALNHAEAMAVVEAARRNDVFLMEAFMYRCHGQTTYLTRLIRSGALGDVRVIEATFSFAASFDPDRRLLNNALGGGGILDVGGYCTSMARLIAGAASGKAFAEPTQVSGAAHIGPISRVDEYATATLTFPGDIIAHLFCGVQLRAQDAVRIYGTKGSIVVNAPWLPVRAGMNSPMFLNIYGQKEQQVTIADTKNLYANEADMVASYLLV